MTNIEAPMALAAIINRAILAANINRLSTSTIGKIESATNSSVTRKPDAEAIFSHNGRRASEFLNPLMGIENRIKYAVAKNTPAALCSN